MLSQILADTMHCKHCLDVSTEPAGQANVEDPWMHWMAEHSIAVWGMHVWRVVQGGADVVNEQHGCRNREAQIQK